MRIDYSNKFSKKYKKLPLAIQIKFEERMQIFKNNKFHPILNNHALAGKWKNYRSINITGDFRAVFRESYDGNFVYIETIDAHSNLYRKH